MSADVENPSTADLATRALERATGRLLELQQPAGWWKAELEANVTIDAEDLLVRQFLGIRGETETRLTAAWIRSKQREDGGWAVGYGCDIDLSATLEAYVALRLAGDPVDAAHMRKAAERIRERGGIESARVFTRIWLALFGEVSWDDLPALPPEVVLLPSWFPLNLYDFASWARQTIVPLTLIAARRPTRQLGFRLDELRVDTPKSAWLPATSWGGFFQRLDRVLHGYERRPWQRLRRAATTQALEWILRRQEADGCWGGIQPPWVYSIMALHLNGYALDHPVLKKGLENLESYTIVEDGMRRFEACQSPVWDTCLSAVALREAGLPPEHPALRKAAEWMLGEEVRVPGDWAVRRPDLEPGGWAFEFENDNYPDLDDTAEVVMALRGAAFADPEQEKRVEAAVQRAIRWTFGMQCQGGGFGAFDVDNTRGLCGELPFCDYGEVIDPPTADVTAHVLEMLADEGLADDPRALEARAWLLAEQEDDGSWYGRWGVNHLYGTGAAVPALVKAGVAPTAAPIRRAVAWIEACQNPDGGYGEDPRSYESRTWRGRGESTPSQTAWALLALLAAGERGPATERAIEYLARTQKEDGDWDEPQFTGTGFPGDFYIRYHHYRRVFPVMALGRYLGARA